MAVTKQLLRELHLTEEQIEAIFDAHVETVDGLKSVNREIQRKLDDAEKALETELGKGLAEKYEKLNKEYTSFREEQTKKETMAAKSKAYVELLKSAGVSDKRIDGILKYDNSKIEALELDEKGAIKNAKDITEAIKTDWADFITTSGTKGAEVSTPPSANNNASFTSMTLNEKMAYANEHPGAPEVTSWLNNSNKGE